MHADETRWVDGRERSSDGAHAREQTDGRPTANVPDRMPRSSEHVAPLEEHALLELDVRAFDQGA